MVLSKKSVAVALSHRVLGHRVFRSLIWKFTNLRLDGGTQNLHATPQGNQGHPKRTFQHPRQLASVVWLTHWIGGGRESFFMPAMWILRYSSFSQTRRVGVDTQTLFHRSLAVRALPRAVFSFPSFPLIVPIRMQAHSTRLQRRQSIRAFPSVAEIHRSK